MTPEQKNIQLIKTGKGVATAIFSTNLNSPFILVAANKDDLLSHLVITCGIEPEGIDQRKFKRIDLRFSSGEKAALSPN